ncbi:hypothetical protein K0U83_27130 [bacterium]|nr:hypothetical protein [bacterium]
MDTHQDHLVVIGARQLDDLLELTARALARLPQGDPLVLALSGSRAEVLASATAIV